MIRRPSDTAPPPAGTAPASAPVSRDHHHQQQQVRDELDLSDLHHINCRYARMSSAQRRRVLEADSGSVAHDRLRHQEYHKAVEAVRFTAAHLKNEDDFSEVRLPLYQSPSFCYTTRIFVALLWSILLVVCRSCYQ